MALRIGGSRAAAPVEEEMPVEEMPVEEPMPEEMMAEEPMPEEPMMEEPMSGTVDPMVAGYKGPELGPFSCANCIHYADNGVCDILAGPVDEAGLCNLFTSPGMAQSELPAEEEMPMEEAPVEEEMPVEEEVVEEG